MASPLEKGAGGRERGAHRACLRGEAPGEGAWQAVAVPGPGAWTLRMGYDDRDVRTGLAVSAAAWASGLLAYFWSGAARAELRAKGTGMIGVAIVGASGYASRELIRILLNHPGARITVATSRQDEAPRVDALHPSLTGRIDLTCEPFDADRIAERASVAFLGLPHTASLAVAPDLRRAGSG